MVMAAKHHKPSRNGQSDWTERQPPPICPTTGKQMYSSQEEAHAVAEHRMTQSPARLRVYLCLFCECWHLTHKES